MPKRGGWVHELKGATPRHCGGCLGMEGLGRVRHSLQDPRLGVEGYSSNLQTQKLREICYVSPFGIEKLPWGCKFCSLGLFSDEWFVASSIFCYAPFDSPLCYLLPSLGSIITSTINAPFST
ncbi:hypothetical protein PIB30_085651 [Stylosanthes scabra]|uniref:Uncharacterized protein n=1 Tax=Stylosanthes scabra TaxID=79078 RepID=A0ABU6ZRJ1_9FABA|nr:hypothetical protein [Stylosanthes scabra]